MNAQISKSSKVNQQELENRVKDMYRKVALHPEVTYHFEMGRTLAERLGYPSKILNRIPSEAMESFAGVGYYFDFGNLKKGEFVADLGSGSGMDVFFAAEQVGTSGGVIGIDMTKEQLQKSILLKNQNGYDQVHFQEGHIENLPIVSNTLDAVLSNGVINLSNEKQQVFNEAARVLHQGGRLILSDIVTANPLPEKITCNVDLWAACIGGAITETSYLEMIKSAGLEVVAVKDNPYAFISKGAKGASAQYGIKSISVLAVKK